MPEDISKVLIAIGAAVVGAILAALANAYAANRKIKEVELVYRQRLQDGYLENARKAAGDVYVPVTIALAKLSTGYEEFRASVNFDRADSSPEAQNIFRADVDAFLNTVGDLLKRGADAYLTIDLDERLQNFRLFVKKSKDAKEVTKKLVLESELSVAPLSVRLPRIGIARTVSSSWRLPNFALNISGIRFEYSEQILAAPLATRDFESRFQTDVLALKTLIKEVTLGSRSAPA